MGASASSSSAAGRIEILTHYVDRLLSQHGGKVKIDSAVYRVSDVADIGPSEARNTIQDSNHFTVERAGNGGEVVITHVSTVGTEPQVVTDAFGGVVSQSDFASLQAVSDEQSEILSESGYHSFLQLHEADPETVAQELNEGLDQRADDADFSSLSMLTDSEADAITDNGVETMRDLATADTSTLTEASATLTKAKAKSVIQTARSEVVLVSEADAEIILEQAGENVQPGIHLSREVSERYSDKSVSQIESTVHKVTETTDTVGVPVWKDCDPLEPEDPEAVYVSDIGENEDEPQQTGFPILSNRDYEKIPKPETHPDAGPGALPVDEDGEVVPPAVPIEPNLRKPVDELVAQTASKGLVPIRLVGPRGSGKNYILKYLCWKTNRGYRSIDVDAATMPEDLFGPLTPDENGVVVPRNGAVKQGLINGDTIVINEFPVMQAGAAMSLHRLLNEGTLLVKQHGELIEPHDEARLIITMNPPTREYRDSEPMNSATRGRFSTYHVPYQQDPEVETESLHKQINEPRTKVPRETLRRIVDFAHRTRENEMWPTLSTRNIPDIAHHIDIGCSPFAATMNKLVGVAEPTQSPEDAEETLLNLLG